MRAKATTESLKAACKTASCALENNVDRQDVELIMDPYKWELRVAKNYYPGAQAWVQYEDDKTFIGGRVRRPKNGVCQNTPRIVGYMILDYATARMIEFLLRMRKICPTPPVLLYMDTDSAIMHLQGEEDPYEVMRRDPELFELVDRMWL